MLHSYLILPFCFLSGYGRDLYPGAGGDVDGAGDVLLGDDTLRLMASSHFERGFREVCWGECFGWGESSGVAGAP